MTPEQQHRKAFLERRIAFLRDAGLGYGSQEIRAMNGELRHLEAEEHAEERAARDAKATPAEIVDRVEGLRGSW